MFILFHRISLYMHLKMKTQYFPWKVFEDNTVSFPAHVFHVPFLAGVFAVSVTFVWLFTRMYFNMLPQTDCPSRCKAKLVAFLWLFSTVGFQMCPQIVCISGCIITVEKSHTNATNVTLHLPGQSVWGSILKYILVKTDVTETAKTPAKKRTWNTGAGN